MEAHIRSSEWDGPRLLWIIYWSESSADCSLTSLLDRSRGTSTACMRGSFLPGQSTRPIGR